MNILSIRIIFIALVLLSGESAHFYVFTSSTCEKCVSAVTIVKNRFLGNLVNEFEISNERTLNSFTKITKIIGEIYLPLPVFGVFQDNVLVALVAGGPTPQQWSEIITESSGGDVPVYVIDGFGNIMNVKTVGSVEEIKNLQDIFLGLDEGVTYSNFWSILLPVIGAAVLDAINPCAFSVLVVMLTFVFYSINRRSVMFVGVSFSLAVFLTYTIMGIGFVQILNRFSYFKYILFIFIIFLGVSRIIEFFTGKNEHLPSSFVNVINKRIEKISTPKNAFFAGVMTALLILPCSSGPYFVALNLVTSSSSYIEGISLIIIYNLIIITPFLLMTFFIHRMIIDTYKIKQLIMEKRRWFNLLIGILLIVLSIFLFI